MKLTSLHLLLTYQCNLECEHCFVWGSPWQSGTLSLRQVREILGQARTLGTVESIYFEGGEPFLYYAVLLQGVREAAQMGFDVGIVSNAYWATSLEDAEAWLRPLAGLVQDLSISSDIYHWSEPVSQQVTAARQAAELLGIPIGTISVAQPEAADSPAAVGQLPAGESAVMYRGRAAEVLVERAARRPASEFNECPYEDLRDPGRIHVDPLGNLHICQGISLGNLFEVPLTELWEQYDPDTHPITGPLLDGGPVELARLGGLDLAGGYADACHLCFTARQTLRHEFAAVLTPNQMYGVHESS